MLAKELEGIWSVCEAEEIPDAVVLFLHTAFIVDVIEDEERFESRILVMCESPAVHRLRFNDLAQFLMDNDEFLRVFFYFLGNWDFKSF